MTKHNKLISIFIAALFAVCAAVGGFVMSEPDKGQVVRKLPQTRGRPSDNPEDINDLRKRAEQGDVAAQYQLASLHINGGEYEEAVKWLHRAAEHGHPEAQHALGYAYDHGKGIPQDYAAAVKWYRRAAEQNVAESQFNLGVSYAMGNGVRQDLREAYIWTSMAEKNGHKDGKEGKALAQESLSPADLPDAESEAARRHAKIQGGTDN